MKGMIFSPNTLPGTALAGVQIGNNGEINANSAKDLINQIGRLMASANTGALQTELSNRHRENNADRRNKQKEILAAAMVDVNKWNQIGTTLAAAINQTGVRTGFIRSILVNDTLNQGDKPQIRVRVRNVNAVISSGPATVNTQFVRSNYIYPAEYDIIANLEVENREIAQDPGDILDEKLGEGQEAVTVTEDRVLKRLFDATVGGANPLTAIVGALTPTILATIIENVTGWGLPAGGALIANDFWKDISTNSNWQTNFDPVSQAEVLLTGRLGTLLGVPVTTDGFRPPEQKVLEAGEIYVFTQAEYLGGMTDRGGVIPTPLNGPMQGRSTRGWFLQELFSAAIGNTRGVAKGAR